MEAVSRSSVDGPSGPGIDPELEALPEPRRPWRRATLGMLAVTALSALALAWSLGPLVTYAARRGGPEELGPLTGVQLAARRAAAWVHTTGALSSRGLEYRRPLDADRYRLVQAEGQPALWIELRIPSGIEPEHYVAPNSFVGRLTPLHHAGIRHAALPGAIESVYGKPPPRDAWLLVDGESPVTTRWAPPLSALLIAFAIFGVWGLVYLLRPARPA
jgi:hypothetical protein